MKILNKEYSKQEILQILKKVLFIMIGNFVLAFGTGIFIVPMGICSGGLSGIAVIIDQKAPGYADIVITALTWGLMIFSFFFLGKQFTLKTLLSSIFYPLFIILFYRVPFFTDLAKQLTTDAGLVEYLLASLFGGALVGTGVAICFSVGGSTGGLDIIACILYKYLKKIKLSYITFSLDASIILLSSVLFWKSDPASSYFAYVLMNIACALTCSLMVEFIYISRNKNVICDVITDKWVELNDYVQNVLLRGTTIIEAKGGYKLEDRKIVRVVIDKDDYELFSEEILKIDPLAFVTYTITKSVIGNGFTRMEEEVKKSG